MQKSPAVRWLALGLAFWLSLVQSDAGVFHACESAKLPETTSAVVTNAADAHSHSHHENEAATQVVEKSADQSTDHHQQHGDGECHCLGHCCPFSAPDLPDADIFALTNIRRLSTTQPGRAAHAVMASWVDFVLPFSTAPPVVIEA
ncbi:MAG: hypothetical protein IBJ03_16940 [Gemmatimonadaceae bacterium]|nr:hypothetical protein [Gemmatimonadaceae bacterium]